MKNVAFAYLAIACVLASPAALLASGDVPAASTPEEVTPVPVDDEEIERAMADLKNAEAKAAATTEPTKEDDDRNLAYDDNVTFNPVGLVVGGISLQYLHGLGDLVTIGLRGVYLAPLLVPYQGVGVELSLFFWPRHPNNGFFAGPLVQVGKTFPRDENYYGITSFAPGVLLGWRWMWKSGFNIGLGGGFGWGFVVARDRSCPSGAICAETGGGATPLVQFDLGYAF